MTADRPAAPAPASPGQTDDFEADVAPGSLRRIPSQRSRYALAAFMAGAGALHFLIPRFYERIVPSWVGHERAAVRWSGVAEVLCGALVALPRTRRAGAWLTIVVLIAVYPANVHMAVDAGKPASAEEWLAWLRLPLQLPMIRWAHRHAR